MILISAGNSEAILSTVGPINSEMRRVVEEQRLGFAATICEDGTANLWPKGTVTVLDDDHLVFADVASPQTVNNLRTNPSIEINVVDPVIRKGFRFKGGGMWSSPASGSISSSSGSPRAHARCGTRRRGYGISS
jgi:predicted pyridoxine 5'-phosphate oxidase superfamily flavin-nucleotide-binding protein